MLYYFVPLLWWETAEYVIFPFCLTIWMELVLGQQHSQCQKAFYVNCIKCTVLSAQSVCLLKYPAPSLAALDASFKLEWRPKAIFSWSTSFINVSDEQKKWQKHQCNISFSKPVCWTFVLCLLTVWIIVFGSWFVSFSSMNMFKNVKKK